MTVTWYTFHTTLVIVICHSNSKLLSCVSIAGVC